jgi:sarcosine oxidase subunit gamma
MSNVVSALNGARSDGFVQVVEVGLRGMITLRGDLASAPIRDALRVATGLEMPAPRGVALDAERGLAWMSPDEVLVMVPYAAAQTVSDQLQVALAAEFALVANVSDARAVFEVSGAQSRDALAKLCPVDLSPAKFAPGQIRRTRVAQVAAAIWMSDEDRFTLVCFRSVATYVFGVLSIAARPGGEVGLY